LRDDLLRRFSRLHRARIEAKNRGRTATSFAIVNFPQAAGPWAKMSFIAAFSAFRVKRRDDWPS